MKKTISLIVLGGLLLANIGCRKIEVDGDGTGNNGGNNQESNILSGKISADRTLKASNTYTLRGLVYVTDGAVLTIEPGTKIVGEKTSRGALIITRGSKIIANGTADKPIVFTSDQPNPQRGDWAGVVIIGRARTNATTTLNGTTIYGQGEAEGGINDAEGNGLFGGSEDADNSGSLKYVRIEYGGYAFLPDKELNGLGLYALGSGTTIDYVQVSYANDDAFECFGGFVNLTHLISYKSLDDDLDTDNGYSGKVQFVIVQRDSNVADISGSNGWESDNDVNGTQVYTPSGLNRPLVQTSAVYSNITLIGPRATTSNVGNSLFKNGAQIRRNSSISLFNSVMMGWPTGLLLDAQTGRAVDLNITQDNNLFVQNFTIAGCNTPLKYTPSGTPTGFDINTWFNTASFNNSILATAAEVKLTDPFNETGNPDYTPQAGSPLLGSASFTHAKLAGFTSVTYRGAVGSGDTWWKGWTKF
jgi:hypothetical protein